MPDPNQTNQPSPGGEDAAPPSLPSLRETIETAYDAVEDSPESSDSGQSDRIRDNLGRFAPKDRDEPGEQSKDPAPKQDLDKEAQPKTEPAPEGSSTRVPEHWSAELKADFAKLQPEGQAILLKRHGEMEADYTRKSQASAGAVQFTQTLAPVFNDPVISGSLQQAGLSASDAVAQWAGFHKRAMSQDPRERVGLLVELTRNMGLDPARIFAKGSPPPALSPEDMADPAIQYFANQQSRTQNELQTLRGELQRMQQVAQKQHDDQIVQETRWTIDQWAEEKDAQGKLLRPYFDAVIEDINELFAADPTRDLQKTYDKCVWANEETRKHMLESQQRQFQNHNSVDRARLAARGNTRGMTSPVAKPNSQANGSGSLRDVLAASADEVGF